ncbi:hypothetical protein MMC13_001812 [Lambiella insularis]|nr:hypothetical protein [Lambiella insularis]
MDTTAVENAKECSSCQAADDCTFCQIIKARPLCQARSNLDFLREFFGREKVLSKQVQDLKVREAHLLANLQGVGLENQTYRQTVQDLQRYNARLRGAFGHSEMERTNAIKALEDSMAQQQAADKAFQLAMNAFARLAGFLTSLSTLADTDEGGQQTFVTEDLILESRDEIHPIDALGDALRRTITRGKEDVEAAKERLYNEMETYQSVITTKDDRIGELMARLDVASTGGTSSRGRHLSLDLDTRGRRNKRHGCKVKRNKEGPATDRADQTEHHSSDAQANTVTTSGE